MDSASFIKNRTLRRNINAYWFLVLFIISSMGYYSFSKFSELIHKSDLINRHHEVLTTLKPELSAEEDEYRKLLESRKEVKNNIQNDLSFVFPTEENYTNLTRELDSFFLGLARSDNPIFVSNLQYGSPTLNEEGNFYVLPINMTVSSSRQNFFVFLDYIESSGSLSDKARLLDIQSIRLNFKEGLTVVGANDEINYSISMNTYFQTPKGSEPINES